MYTSIDRRHSPRRHSAKRSSKLRTKAVGWGAMCRGSGSLLLSGRRGRWRSRMMHRRVKLADRVYDVRIILALADRSRSPNPRHSVPFRWPIPTVWPLPINIESRPPSVSDTQQRPCCGQPAAKANRVSWVGKHSANVIDAVGKLYAAMHHAGPPPTAAPREQKASRPTTPGTPFGGLCPQSASRARDWRIAPSRSSHPHVRI
jgi:hypothetical protein